VPNDGPTINDYPLGCFEDNRKGIGERKTAAETSAGPEEPPSRKRAIFICCDVISCLVISDILLEKKINGTG